MKKLLSAAILTAMTLTIPAANAADWVYVSSWAYNDVSNFTNEGLLPDTFAEVSDYRAPATLEQISELLCSVFQEVGNFTPDTRTQITGLQTYSVLNLNICHHFGTKIYTEIPSEALDSTESQLSYVNANYGQGYISDDWYGSYVITFDPSKYVTRECAAILFSNSCQYRIPFSTTAAAMEDRIASYDMPDPNAVRWCKENEIMDAEYEPDEYITIEQAITAAYRAYLAHPATSRPDGNEDGYIRTYSNGIEEHRSKNTYVLKRNSAEIAVFESDVYKNIYCTDTTDGRTLAAAEHFMKYTDIYDLSSGAVVATIPYRTDSLRDNCIITKNPTENGILYGACDYYGNTLLEPLYSKQELDALHSIGFTTTEELPRPADGWLYFIGDGDKLYRVDTNGENEQCISDMACIDFQYKNGTIYAHSYHTDGEKLWAMNADGSDVKLISEDIDCFYGAVSDGESRSYKDFGEWVYYMTNDASQLWQVKKEGTELINESVQSGIELTGTPSVNRIIRSNYSDEKYTIKYSSGDPQITFTDFFTDEEIVINLSTPLNIAGRFENMLLIIEIDNGALNIYDMDSRTMVKRIDNVYGLQTIRGSDLLCKTISGNTLRINLKDADHTVEEIYPCKGIYRYSALDTIVLLGNRKPHKLDKNGFYLPLTSQSVSDYALVLN